MSGEIELTADQSENECCDVTKSEREPVEVRDLSWVIDCACCHTGLEVGDQLKITDTKIQVTRAGASWDWGKDFKRSGRIPATVLFSGLTHHVTDDGGEEGKGKLICEKGGVIEPQVVWTAQEGSGVFDPYQDGKQA